jgi:hypothetical protein
MQYVFFFSYVHSNFLKYSDVPCDQDCNCTDTSVYPFGSLVKMNPDGTNKTVHVTGIRNTLGFTWHPESGVTTF